MFECLQSGEDCVLMRTARLLSLLFSLSVFIQAFTDVQLWNVTDLAVQFILTRLHYFGD